MHIHLNINECMHPRPNIEVAYRDENFFDSQNPYTTPVHPKIRSEKKNPKYTYLTFLV